MIEYTRNFTYSTLYPKQMFLSYVNITTAVFQTYVSRKSQKNALRHCNYVWKQCCHIINKIWHLHFTQKNKVWISSVTFVIVFISCLLYVLFIHFYIFYHWIIYICLFSGILIFFVCFLNFFLPYLCCYGDKLI